MALKVKVGSFNIGTDTVGSTIVETIGFQMVSMILWWSGRTESSDAIGNATHLRGIGFAVGSTSFRAICSRDADAADPSNTDAGHRSDACIVEIGDGSFVGWADVQSVSSTAITFEILSQFTTNLRVGYIAFGGDNLTAEIGNFSTLSTTGSQTINTTNLGSILFTLSTQTGTAAPALWATSGFVFGAAKSTSSEYVCSGVGDNAAATTDTHKYCRGGDCLAIHSSSSDTGVFYAEFTSFNSSPNGFTINKIAMTVNRIIHYMILGGSDADNIELGEFTTLTSTGTITVSGLSIAPTAVMCLSSSAAEHAAGAGSAGDEWSVGAADSLSNRFCMQINSVDNQAAAVVESSIQYDEIYVNTDNSGVIEGSADIASFTSDGFTLDMDDADPVASFCWFIAAEGESAAPASTIQARHMRVISDLQRPIQVGNF